jgi:negative regulator of replication initiation
MKESDLNGSAIASFTAPAAVPGTPVSLHTAACVVQCSMTEHVVILMHVSADLVSESLQ